MTDREKLIDRIRKIRALAEDDATSEAAAANYMMKMAELMRQHAVEEHELAGDVKDLNREGVNKENKYFDAWRRDLMNECSLMCGTYYVMYRKSRPAYWRIYGRPEAIEATHEMFQFIEKQIVALSRMMYADTKSSRQAQKGLSIGVCRRLWELRDEQKLEASTSTALVVMETEAELSKEAMEAELGDVPNMRRKRVRATSALVNGIANAEKIKLHKEVK